MLGSASFIVLDETVPIVRAAARMVEFFRHESCGKCTPCREGTQWLHKTLVRIQNGGGREEDLDLLLSVSGEISGKVLCALGDFATSPVDRHDQAVPRRVRRAHPVRHDRSTSTWSPRR